MEVLADVAAEKAIISGVCKFGNNGYYEVADIIKSSTFTVDSNINIFACLKHIIDNDQIKSIDIPSIHSAANQLGLLHFLNRRDELEHLQAIFKFPVLLENLRKFAIQLRKLEIARDYHVAFERAQDKILQVTGTESIGEILSIGEDAVTNFYQYANDDDNPIKMGENLQEYLQFVMENPCEQVGISTGNPIYDAAIGGGLRPGAAVTVIGARRKIGKSVFGQNVGVHVAKNLNIKSLVADTEMSTEEFTSRFGALLSETNITEIETGQFAKSDYKKRKVLDSADQVKDIPYYYKSLNGMDFEEQLSTMRRWVIKEVGLKNNGTANECVIIYDYLKLTEHKDLNKNVAEWQLLGFMIDRLNTFSKKYKVPILAFVQLNREGDIAASDRITWFCSSFSILKEKSTDELAEDGPNNGNRKLQIIIARHGPGLSHGEYINFTFKGWCSKLTELSTNLQQRNNQDNDEGNEEIRF